MSVWKKAAKANQKTHRERHQPDARKHLGLLEKKQDYIKRATHHNKNQETIKLLRKRALNKNPDEFYYHMINSKVEDGIHHEKDTRQEHSGEQLQLMETQDIRYVNMKRTQEMKKIERLQSQLHLIDVNNKPKNKHKVFFNSKEELENYKKKIEEGDHLNYSLDKLSEKPLSDFNEETLVEINKKREKNYKNLASRIKREKELLIVQQKLEIKRYLQPKKGTFPPKKVQEGTTDTAPVYKWRSQRKR